MTAPTIAVTVYPDANPAPRAEVLVTNPAGATLTITRTADGRTMPVRGAIRRPTASGVPVIDTEIPFGVAVTYQAEMFDSVGGSLGFVTSASVTLDVAGTWVHQPLEPRLCARVDLTDDSAGELQRGFDADTVWPDGATLGVQVAGRRRGLEGVQLTLEPGSVADADRLQAMLGTYDVQQVAVLCIRTPPGYTRLPRTLFLSCPKPVEADVNVRYGGTLTQLRLQGDEVRPPAPGLSSALLRYSDTDAFYGTYSGIDAAYGSYLARDRDYDKAGFAG